MTNFTMNLIDNFTEYDYQMTLLNSSTNVSDLGENTAMIAELELKESVYTVMLPALVGFLVFSALISLTVQLSIPFIRRPISPIVRLSLSLSCANTAFNVTVALGIVVHSYLPFVHQIQVPACFQLTVEAVRLSIILVQVYHLLAVALIHYCGTVRPLQYTARMSPSKMKTLIGVLWTVPHVLMVSGFALIPGQGYQSDGCRNVYFLLHGLNFRVIWCSVIVGPTIFLIAVYCRIFVLLSSRASQIVTPEQRNQLKRNIKTVRTTALIVGTFIIGWFPAAVTFVVVCKDCLVKDIQPKSLQMALFSSNYIIFILKVFADTFIYVLGLRDIREGTTSLWHTIRHRWLSLKHRNDPEYSLNNRPSRPSAFRSTKVTYFPDSKSVNSVRRISFNHEPSKLKRMSAPNINFVNHKHSSSFDSMALQMNVIGNTNNFRFHKQNRIPEYKSVDLNDIELKTISDV